MSGLREAISHTIQTWDQKFIQWASTSKAQSAPVAETRSEPVRAVRSSPAQLGHVSEDDLAAAVAALKNMKQLSAWVKHESTGFSGYAAGGAKAHHHETLLS